MFEWRASDWVGQIRQANHDKVSLWIPKEKLIYIYDPKQRKVPIIIDYFNSFENYYLSNDFHYIIFKTISGFRIMDVRLNKIVLVYNKMIIKTKRSTPFLSQEFDQDIHKILKDCNFQGLCQLQNKQQLQYWCLQESLIIYNKQRNSYIFERPNTRRSTFFIREGDVQFNSNKQNQYFMSQNQKISHFIRLNNYQKRIRAYKVPLAKFQIQITSKYLLITQIQVERFYENPLYFSKKQIIIMNIYNMRLINLDNNFQGMYISITQDSKYIIYSNKDVIGQIDI